MLCDVCLFSCAREHHEVSADHIKSSLDEVAGDIGATWRTAQNLLHNNHKAVYSDSECPNLVSTFSEFFTDKVDHIRSSITAVLQSTARHVFTDRLYFGPLQSLFQPLMTEEVRPLLSVHHAIPVVAARRVAMFAAEVVCGCRLVGHHQTSQPVDTDWKVSRKI